MDLEGTNTTAIEATKALAAEVPPDAAAEAEAKRERKRRVLADNAKKGKAKKRAQKDAQKAIVEPPVEVPDKPKPPLVQLDELAGDPLGQQLVQRFTKPLESSDDLAELMADLFAVPEVLLDESFALAGPDGKPNARCRTGARRLWPLVRKYDLADKLPLYIPELLAVAGAVGLLKPCVKPTWEILTGKRAPLVWRDLPADASDEQLVAKLADGAERASGLQEPEPFKANGAVRPPEPKETH